MDNQQATELEIGWLAGIIDGEGWLGMTVETEHWRRVGQANRMTAIRVECRITNTDRAIIERTAEIMRKLGVNPYVRDTVKTSIGRQAYDVSVKRLTGVAKILAQVGMHLTGNKYRRGELVTEFIRRRKANEGAPNPMYENYNGGRFGPRTIRPYTQAELDLVEECLSLQDHKGASETTRERRHKLIQLMRERAPS